MSITSISHLVQALYTPGPHLGQALHTPGASMSKGFIQRDKTVRHPFGPACAMPKENSSRAIVYLDYQFCKFVSIQAQAGPKGFPKLFSFLIRPFGHAFDRTKCDESWDELLGQEGYRVWIGYFVYMEGDDNCNPPNRGLSYDYKPCQD